MDIFGKRKLEEKIAELEIRLADLDEQRSELQRTLERREDRLKKLAADYQETSRALKEAQSRLATAAVPAQVGAPERIPAAKESVERLRSSEILRLLARLEECHSSRGDLLSLYLPPGDSQDLPPPLTSKAGDLHLKEGSVIFHYPLLFSLELVPAIPPRQRLILPRGDFELSPLREIMETPVLVISAHAGDTLLGLALNHQGFQLLERVKGQVKEKHSKGGWSQRRFERLREEEIRHHAGEVIARLQEMGPRIRDLAKLAVVSGDQSILRVVIPSLEVPVVESNLGHHERRRPEDFVGEVYGALLYRLG